MLETFRDRGTEVWICRGGLPSGPFFQPKAKSSLTSYLAERISSLFLERETGLEPATSSLGNFLSFVNKRLMRLRRWFLAT